MREDAFSLDVEALAAMVADLGRGHAAMSALAADLERRIDELHLSWDGQAAQAHRLAQAAWNQGFEEMRDALARMREAADCARHNYVSAATVNQHLWEQVR